MYYIIIAWNICLNDYDIDSYNNYLLTKNMLYYNFKLQTSNTGELDVDISEGKTIFVLGANGVGKSTLMHNLFTQNNNHVKRILAHRQTWFSSNAMNMTAAQKKQQEQSIKNSDRSIDSRWMDSYSPTRSSISIFDLINSENVRARDITCAVDANDLDLAKDLSNKQAPIKAINELLKISNIPIIISLGKDEQLFASKNGSMLYSIAELSDGERNALLICADVLTTDPNHLIIIDEPERHLHRSIITPLLSSLFQKRNDCAFVISTHDISLPIDHPNSSILLLRGCAWDNKNIKNWDADLITNSDKIPKNIKLDILGAKRKILFVEGEDKSLDKQIYQLIFPNVTVIPYGNCYQVERAVDGIRGAENLHWINAYGLIDADDKTPEQLDVLIDRGIAALECYSVESLYYNLEVVKLVVKRYSEIIEEDEDVLYNKAISNLIPQFQKHKVRLCARLCEKYVRNSLMSKLPKWKQIAEQDNFEPPIINLKEILENEQIKFDGLVAQNNLNGLIARYPVRETQVLDSIVSGIGITRDKYESSVRRLIIDDEQVKELYKKLLYKLNILINN